MALVAALVLLVGGGGATGLAVHRAAPAPEPDAQTAAVLRAPAELVEPVELVAREEAPVAADAEPAQDTRSAVALPAPGLELVVAGSEEPLVGAVVVWREAGRRRRVESDADGRVDFAPDLGAGDLHVDVAATEHTVAHRVEVPGGVRTRVVVPRRGGRLVGCAVDLDGVAVPFAEILAWSDTSRRVDLDHPAKRTVADQLGQFVLDDLGDENGRRQFWSLAARAPGLATFAAFRGQVDPREAEEHLFLVLEPAWEVFGRVSDASGRPLADVPLVVFHSGGRDLERRKTLASMEPGWNSNPSNPRFDLRSAPDGSFALQIVGPGEGQRGSWRLQANSPNHRVTLLDIEGPGRLDVQLEWGSRLDGVVLDASRRPVEGARVGLIVRDRRTPVVTDALGRFEFEGLSDLEGGRRPRPGEGPRPLGADRRPAARGRAARVRPGARVSHRRGSPGRGGGAVARERA